MPDDDELIGRSLRGGEYVLTEVIARGGQATIYRAYARALETDVAVKVLDRAHAADLGFRERLHDEARRLAQLHHPNLLEVHWYGEEAELVYIVMRLVPGGTLLRRLQALGGALGLTDAARLIAQVASALQHAHDAGILHLDVKPANVLLGQADWPLVADFGLTQAIAHQSTSAGHLRIAGTPAYMSPEQCRGDALDPRSDQYSLAVTAYELLVGQQPFHADTTEGLLQHHLYSSPPRPSSVNPGLPAPIEDVLLRGLAKDPNDRFPSINAFAHALSSAVERTRGISLEAKHAAAATAPNLLAVLALVLAAPFLLAMLPVGTLFGRLPLAWPFQGLLAAAIAALLLGIRWHLIGLVSRVVGTTLHSFAWRRSAQSAAHGVVNLLYLLATYRLVGGPLLGILRALLEPSLVRLLDTAVLVLVGALALAIVVTIFRSAGPLPAALVLAAGWSLAVLLPTAQLDLAGAQSLAAVAQLVVATGVLLLLLTQRPANAAIIGRFVANSLGRLLVEAHPGISPERANAAREQLLHLTATLLDFAYLLLAYALLRSPLIALLAPLSSPLAAAIIASALACAAWLLLVARLRWIAGLLGLALGLVLGAPILLSLPLLDASVLQSTWPATVATWLAGVMVLLLLAALRGPTQALAQTALGKRFDRGLLGSATAPSESLAAQRATALGRVVAALLDVAFLLVIYWALGVPLTNALVRATGQPVISSLVLAAVLLLAIASVIAAARRAAATIVETSGALWSARARALVALTAASTALFVALGAAAPAAIAGPTPTSPAAFSPDLARTIDQVVVDWEFWLPWTPRSDQATYTLSLSCSNGHPIGQFREAFTPPPGAPMPAGPIGRLGPTSVACDDWQQVFTAHRRAAGLPNTPTYSWDWVDLQASLNPDQSVSITQTHRVFFSAGRHSSLDWTLGPASPATSIDNLDVSEGDLHYPLGPAGTPTRSAQLTDTNGQRVLTWTFPTLTAPIQRTFTIRYRLRGPLSTDPKTLFYQVVAGADRVQPVWDTTVEVHLPSGLDTSALQLDTSGADAHSGLLDPQTAVFSAQDIAAGDGLMIAIVRTDGL